MQGALRVLHLRFLQRWARGARPLGECPNNPVDGKSLGGDADYEVVVERRIRTLEARAKTAEERAAVAEEAAGRSRLQLQRQVAGLKRQLAAARRQRSKLIADIQRRLRSQ
jgi:hypothetical protein